MSYSYKRQGNDYPLYPGTSIGQVVRRDGYTIKDKIWYPVINPVTKKKTFKPKIVDRIVIIEFTWYGKGWKRREVIPAMKDEKMENKVRVQKEVNKRVVNKETEEERTNRILANLGYRF